MLPLAIPTIAGMKETDGVRKSIYLSCAEVVRVKEFISEVSNHIKITIWRFLVKNENSLLN